VIRATSRFILGLTSWAARKSVECCAGMGTCIEPESQHTDDISGYSEKAGISLDGRDSELTPPLRLMAPPCHFQVGLRSNACAL